MTFIGFGFASLHAQTTGEEYVPSAGTVALGASVNIANIFTNFGDGVKVPSLSLQYYIANKTAVRATFGINSTSNLDKFYVRDDAAFVLNPLSNTQVVDTKKAMSSSYNSSFAIQQFFGEAKLRGFIGLQAIYGAGSANTVNTYANPMNAINPLPTSYPTAYSGSQRALETKTASTYSVGGGIIAGFEYYVLPRLSIGGEMSLNAIYSHAGQSNAKSETVVNGEVVTVDQAVSPGATSLEIKSLGYASKDMKEQIGFYIMYHF